MVTHKSFRLTPPSIGTSVVVGIFIILSVATKSYREEFRRGPGVNANSGVQAPSSGSQEVQQTLLQEDPDPTPLVFAPEGGLKEAATHTAVASILKGLDEFTARGAVLTRGLTFQDMTREELAKRILEDVREVTEQEGSYTQAEVLLAGGVLQIALRLNDESWEREWNIPMTVMLLSLGDPEREEASRLIALTALTGEKILSLEEIATLGGVLPSDIEYVRGLTVPAGYWDPAPTPYEEQILNLLLLVDTQEWRGMISEEILLPMLLNE